MRSMSSKTVKRAADGKPDMWCGLYSAGGRALSPRGGERGLGELRKVHLGDVGEPEVLIVARALLPAEEVDLVAEATVVEVDGERLAALQLELGFENRADLAAGAVVDRHRGTDDALDDVLVGRDRRP